MIKIAIIDDNELFCNSFKSVIEKYIKKIASNYSINIISTDFFESIKDIKYDIIFLDIDLINVNGINLSTLIIKNSKRIPLIIFVSSRNDLIFDSLSVQPFHFIRKSNLKSDLIICLNLLRKHFKMNEIFLTFQYKGRKTSIRNSDIIYIESDYHDISIITQTDEYVYRSTLKSLLVCFKYDNVLMYQY